MESLKVIEEPAPASHIHGLPEKAEMERRVGAPETLR